MVKELLKIAGVKTKKEFYDLYPTEEAFEKAHGKAFKKAKLGASIQDKGQAKKLKQLTGFDNPKKAKFGVEKPAASTTSSTPPLNFKNPTENMIGKFYDGTEGSNPELQSLQGFYTKHKNSVISPMTPLDTSGYDQASSILTGLGKTFTNMAAPPKAQDGDVQCGSGFKWDQVSQQCLPDFSIPIPDQQNTTAAPDGPGDYEEVQKINYNNPLSGGTPKTGPGTGVNPASSTTSNADFLGGVGKYLNTAGKIVQGVKALKEEKEQRRYAEQQKAVSDVALMAAKTSPEPTKRKYVRPEDVAINPNELFPTYGVGTNYIAKEGISLIGGNPTEIQNTYNPGNLYMDLGYEPLNDSTKVKQYQMGGAATAAAPANIPTIQSAGTYDREGNYIPDWQDITMKARRMNARVVKVNGSIVRFDRNWNIVGSNNNQNIPTAQGGFDLGAFANAGGGAPVNQIFGGLGGMMSGGGFNQNAGSNLGGTIGSTVGGFFGPVGGLIGGAVGSLAGGALDKNAARIKKANEATQRNLQNMAWMSGANTIHNQYSSYLEDGGYVSHNWNPQVITKFGDIDVSQIHNIATAGMDTLRSGGHISQNRMSPMDQYAFGGDLQTHWGGRAEPIAYNPYLPGSGEVVMFRGQSHDQSDGKGRTGIGVSYGNTGSNPLMDYAEYGTDAATDKASVEVENNEPAIEGVDPTTGQPIMHVLGDMTVSRAAANFIGNPKLAGTKYKHAGKRYAEKDAKTINKINDLANQINNLDIQTPFDKLKLMSLAAMMDGYNADLRESAQQLQDMAAYQGFINDTSSQLGLVAKDLAVGKIKFDKNAQNYTGRFGTTVSKAARGSKVTGDPVVGTSRLREGLNSYGAKATMQEIWDGKNWIPAAEYIEKIRAADPNIMYQIDENGIYTGTKDLTTGIVTSFPQDNGSSKSSKSTSSSNTTVAPSSSNPGRKNKKLTKAQYDELVKLYDEAAKGDAAKVEEFQKKFHEYLPEIAEDIVRKDKHITKKGESMGYTDKDLKTLPQDKLLETNVDGIFGNRTKKYRALMDENIEDEPTTTIKPIPTTEATTTKPLEVVPPLERNKYVDIVNQVMPWLRESDVEPLDMAQLYPEMYALSSNQLEPVQASKFNPYLNIPYDISLQDQLNANQADFNSMQRYTGYNPSAQGSLAAQKYAANSKVLGEQFRLNQAEKAGVYNKNRDILNEADLKNLQILDQQYVRQSQAKSNTKAVTMAALNSIADKVAKHKLENRTLATYENLYNYRYDPRFRAINQNAPWQPTIPNVSGAVPVYDANGNITGYQQLSSNLGRQVVTTSAVTTGAVTTSQSTTLAPVTTTTAPTTTMRYGGKTKKEIRNGNIVRAIKGL